MKVSEWNQKYHIASHHPPTFTLLVNRISARKNRIRKFAHSYWMNRISFREESEKTQKIILALLLMNRISARKESEKKQKLILALSLNEQNKHQFRKSWKSKKNSGSHERIRMKSEISHRISSSAHTHTLSEQNKCQKNQIKNSRTEKNKSQRRIRKSWKDQKIIKKSFSHSYWWTE